MSECIHDFTGQEDGSWKCSCGFDRDCPKCAKWKEAGASWPRPCKEHAAPRPPVSPEVEGLVARLRKKAQGAAAQTVSPQLLEDVATALLSLEEQLREARSLNVSALEVQSALAGDVEKNRTARTEAEAQLAALPQLREALERIQAILTRVRRIPTDCWGNIDVASSDWPTPEEISKAVHRAGEIADAALQSPSSETPAATARSVDDYCAILFQWAEMAVAKGILRQETVNEVKFAVLKSSYLGRRLYGGEEHRTEPCPVHKGRWSGLPLGSDPPCGCDLTGWLRAARGAIGSSAPDATEEGTNE